MEGEVAGSARPAAIASASRASIGLSTSSSSRISIRVIVGDHERGRPERRPRKEVGGDLLSREVALRVPSALAGLTSLFGMGRGVPPPLSPPKLSGPENSRAHPQNSIATQRIQIKTSGN